MIALDGPDAVRAAAGLFSDLAASGQEPPFGMYRAILAAARVTGLLQDPAVLTAAKWQDWLHPRGKDGRFIQKDSFVNVFASENALLNDRTAVRRRARIVDLRPEGAYVAYQDRDGKPLEADPGAGFPSLIPVNQLSGKVANAPQAIAHLNPDVSAREEFDAGYAPALSQKDYDALITQVNAEISADYPDEHTVVAKGQPATSDQEFLDHLKFVQHVQDAYIDSQNLTYDKAFRDSYGMWSEEWHQIFDAVVDEAYDRLTENQTKPRQNRAIMLGGMPGAGKSSSLKQMAKARAFSDEEWVQVNPDIFKDLMLEKGLFPKIDGLAPAETASFIHAASSEMNYMLEQLLMTEGYNLIFDITMGGQTRPGRKANHEVVLDELELMDYTVDGIFVDVPPNVSRFRTLKRHKDGLDSLRTGRSREAGDPAIDFGGRMVPDWLIDSNALKKNDPDAQKYNSQNARNFDQLKSRFVRWSQWDNSEEGTPAVYVDGSGSGPDDRENSPGYYSGEAA